MSVHDADLNDIYVDEAGKMWRVMALCGEPTVRVQEIETLTPESPVTRSGGVSGFMWKGFKRIHRPEKPKPPEKTFVSNSDTDRLGDRHYDSQGYCDNPGRGY